MSLHGRIGQNGVIFCGRLVKYCSDRTKYYRILDRRTVQYNIALYTAKYYIGGQQNTGRDKGIILVTRTS
jgi:hypothetical protein